MAANVAAVSLALEGGADLADKIDPRLVELTLSEKRGEDADQLDIVLQNHDGLLEIPVPGRTLLLSLGWVSGDSVPTGLVDKGRYTVDEVSEEGPPDIVTIRARSADLTGKYRKRRTKAWKDTTLGALLREIAARHDRTARVETGLAALRIDVIEQEGKSDMAFVRDLGRRYDAIATWKDGLLVFAPIGASASVSGTPLGDVLLERRDGWKWKFSQASREDYDGAEAQWQDTDAGRRRTVKTGGDNRRRLKRVYASEREAARAAESAAARGKRAPYSFTYDLAIADPQIQPDQKVTLQGWSGTIDSMAWLVESVETKLGAGGLSQSIKLESA